jgi:arginine N-succinyltransferase
MFLLREIRRGDLDDLEKLAQQLDTLNLPNDRERLKRAIETSRRSFAGEHDSIEHPLFVFALRDLSEDRLIGTCLIVAKHGTSERPAVYFDIHERTHYSTTLDRQMNHRILELEVVEDGPSEIGGLVLAPEYRGHKLKLGKWLSFIRFLYMGMHPELFEDAVVAELLPPLDDNNMSEMWRHLGAKFTQLDYRTADRISRENVEFIQSLFPKEPIYESLLPDRVQKDIGTVGEDTKPAEHMLRGLGFQWDGTVDPFDGGPTFRCEVENCEAINRTRSSTFTGTIDGADADGKALVGYEYDDHEVRFRAAFGEYLMHTTGIRFGSPVVESLGIEEGDECGFLPLTVSGLRPLW